MEKIEVVVNPNQSKEIERIILNFQVPHIRIESESNKIQYFLYVITVPENIVGIMIEKLAEKLDNKQNNNIINHYKIESTISNYLDNYDSFFKSDDNSNGNSKINIDDNKNYRLVISVFILSIKKKIKEKRQSNRPIEELISQIDSFSSKKNDVYVMALLATIISLVGLITNNVAVIIGSMLISPLLGPISSVALNTVLGRYKEIGKSVRFLLLMLVSSILLSAAITFGLSLVMDIEKTYEIQTRTNERTFSILVALILGISGGLSLLTSIREIIAGVAIAVALIPPAAVVGIGIGTGSLNMASDALQVKENKTIYR